MKRVPIVLKRVPPEAEVQEVRMPTGLSFELRANTFHRRQTTSALGTLLLGIGLGAGLGLRLQEFEPEP